jgi:predicted DNA-binding transcriptional regulator YafY
MPLLTALHRYSDVKLLDEAIRKVPGFDIDEYIAEGNLGPKNSGDGLKKFKAKIYKTTATHLVETPIHSAQKISAPNEDGGRTITAELPITHEFRYFLMSYHAEVIVEKPISLRNWMKESVQKCITTTSLKSLSYNALYQRNPCGNLCHRCL